MQNNLFPLSLLNETRNKVGSANRFQEKLLLSCAGAGLKKKKKMNVVNNDGPCAM